MNDNKNILKAPKIKSPIDETITSQRIDKWLHHARFFKTRSLASSKCKGGIIKINGVTTKKSSTTLQVGDMLSFFKSDKDYVIEVLAFAKSRLGAKWAIDLYKDHSPTPTPCEKEKTTPLFTRERGTGRPTKKQARDIRKLLNTWHNSDWDNSESIQNDKEI